MDEGEDSRLMRTKRAIRSLNTVPLSYNHQQHNVLGGERHLSEFYVDRTAAATCLPFPSRPPPYPRATDHSLCLRSTLSLPSLSHSLFISNSLFFYVLYSCLLSKEELHPPLPAAPSTGVFTTRHHNLSPHLPFIFPIFVNYFLRIS